MQSIPDLRADHLTGHSIDLQIDLPAEIIHTIHQKVLDQVSGTTVEITQMVIGMTKETSHTVETTGTAGTSQTASMTDTTRGTIVIKTGMTIIKITTGST